MDAPTKPSWKAALADRVPEEATREIDLYETQMDLRRQGKVDDKLFAETRLRRGAYGQRYDNGRRHDGEKTRAIPYPSDLTKGPDTLWEAPGMQRIKLPFGGLDTGQMETLADVAEEYSDAILHVTTRQDIQLHFVHLDDTPDLQRRLAAVGITTREACGNAIRNVTACPYAGICRDEAFDVTPYADAATWFLLGHRDTQDFGRKFKLAFSGCARHACGLTYMHDMGCIARTRTVGGEVKRGFTLYVGGGLGAIPHQAKLFDEFLPEEELLPVAQAIARVYARLGEKKNRAKARIKFLVAKLGIDELRRLVLEERRGLEEDPRWTDWLAKTRAERERPRERPVTVAGDDGDLTRWAQTNLYPQRQAGYVAVTVTLPLGDLTSDQMRRLAAICRRYVNETVRTTVEQNIMLRWVHEADVPALYRDLAGIDLAAPGAETIVDVTACPGTDTCKLGIASSRGLAAELRRRLAAKRFQYDQSLRDLRIKVSGCFNACGQHHVAEIGFYGVSRTLHNYKVPHFQLILGGEWRHNGQAFGLAMGAVPSKRVPEAVERLLDLYLTRRDAGEGFRALVTRVGKKEIKALVKDLTVVPPYSLDPSFYTDWADARAFTLGDMGVGECAGEVVSATEFGIAAAEGEVFEAQLHLEEGPGPGSARRAADKALSAMLLAAQALVKLQNPDIADDGDGIMAEFRRRFYDTEVFFDPFAGGRFAHLFFHAYETREEPPTPELAHRRVEEAQLFIEAAHGCYSRLLDGGAPAPFSVQAGTRAP